MALVNFKLHLQLYRIYSFDFNGFMCKEIRKIHTSKKTIHFLSPPVIYDTFG
jgi:lipid A disaccharide synthetase